MLIRICLFFTILFSLQGEEPKLCLAMTVKNEGATIWRCLNSVKKIIDCVCICNVESTDCTLLAIEEMMQEEALSGRVFAEKQLNRGDQQTLLIQRAQETLEELGFSLESSYILILEPNQVLKIRPSFSKKDLCGDSYLLFEKLHAARFCQHTMNLFRASLNWKCSGSIYERWLSSNPPEKFPFLQIDTLEIDEKHKLESDLEKLSEAIQLEPNNSYYLFYLAQTQRALTLYREAIRSYQEYIQKKEDEEKAWLSRYMIGECYEALGNWEKALNAYLEAYQADPDRAEPLWKIASYYRSKGKNDLGYLFAKHGSRIPSSKKGLFSPFSALEDYAFDEELSISAYYTRFKEEGFLAADNLILNRNVPHYLKTNTFQNLLFYVAPLPNASFLPIDIQLPDLYHPMNPSIQKTPTGYKVICRTVNYTQEGAKTFHTSAPDGIFRTRNFLLDYTVDFKVRSQQEILEDLPRERIPTFSRIEGLDDCRLFEYQNAFWFACTTGDTNPCGNFQISLCKLEEPFSDEEIYVETLTPLKGPDPYRCEKNWLPFIHQGQLHLIYSYSPFLIYQPDLETGDCTPLLSYEPKSDFSSFRGSAAPIPFENGYLMLVHEVTFFENQSRCYLHRFLYLDDQFVVRKLSLPFTFKHQGVEFCCGMTTDHTETQLILSIGIEDREAYLCFIDLETVRSLLKPVES